MTPEELAALTDGELAALVAQTGEEMERRRSASTIPAQMEQLNQEWLASAGVVPGQEWTQPAAAFDAYPEGWEVVLDGKRWVSLTRANVWQPGTAGWRELVPAAAAPAAWVQPVGSVDAYKKGDKVTFNGEVYSSLLDANVWSPTGYPAGWQKV